VNNEGDVLFYERIISFLVAEKLLLLSLCIYCTNLRFRFMPENLVRESGESLKTFLNVSSVMSSQSLVV